MFNFDWYNPTRIVFGKNTISELKNLISKKEKVMILYGGGSIKSNGTYDEVKKALTGYKVVEFSGIEPNPEYETCLKAVESIKKNKVTFLLAVGGGSVGDATKFIAAATKFKGRNPWEILKKHGANIKEALPLGCVLTLPATGTEANPNAVISRSETKEKLALASDLVRPVFSILDPEKTYTLDKRQTVNGIIDAYVHVCEQYLTYDVNAALQDRQAEAILSTLIEQAPIVLKKTTDYDARANIMYSAYQALNLHLSCGVPTDWATHMIGHELTALYGVDHAISLAIVQPGIMTWEKKRKRSKLLQYGARVFGITKGTPDKRISEAIDKTEKFYRSLGAKTRLKEHGIPADACQIVAERLNKQGFTTLGEHGDIDGNAAAEILKLRV